MKIDPNDVYEETLAAAPSDDDVLDFYTIAIDMGADQADAERIDEILTLRVMREAGAV